MLRSPTLACKRCEYPIRNGVCACNYFEPEDGPGEEDGPWADGWRERTCGDSVVLLNNKVSYHADNAGGAHEKDTNDK